MKNSSLDVITTITHIFSYSTFTCAILNQSVRLIPLVSNSPYRNHNHLQNFSSKKKKPCCSKIELNV